MPLALLVILLGLLPAAVQAAPGNLDPSFGTGGSVITDLGGEDYARDVTTDSSGRVVVVGRSERSNQTESEAIVVRYTASGQLDPTFGGGDGIVPLHFGVGSFDSAAAVAIDGSGRIMVAGGTESDISCTSYCHAAIARLTSNGQLDPSFAGDGTVTINVDHNRATSVAIDASGRVLVGTDSAVYRFTEAGMLDSSFGNSGMAPLAAGSFAGLAIDGAGRIVAAEYYAVERLLDTGEPDPSFSEDGVVFTNGDVPGSSDFVETMAVDGNNRIVLGGITFLPESEIDGQPFVMRYTSSGTLDPSIAGDGVVLGGEEGRINDLTIDNDGRYLAVGYSDELSPTSDILIRYLPDGSLDPGFGGSFGFAQVPFFTRSVTTDPDQRIVVAGIGGEDIDFAVARYLGDTTLSPSPPPPSPSLPALNGSPGPTAHSDAPRTKLGKAIIRRHSRVATFTFSAPGRADTTFRCKLDSGPFTPCRSPKTYRALKPGRHVFRVQASDALGQIDKTPAIKRFRISRA